MRASIAIAAHNEGELLLKTVRSCVETTAGLDCEILVVDDGSTDGSAPRMLEQFPQVRVIRREGRCGTSSAKDISVRESLGDVVVVLDGHCKPEAGAIERLIEDVELSGGDSIVSPTIQVLDPRTWKSEPGEPLGYWLDLEWFVCSWLEPSELKSIRGSDGRLLYQMPSFVGCSLAVSRKLYESLGGFDPGFVTWGSDDIDLSLRTWMLGHSILLDPEAVIGHRFRSETDITYTIPPHDCLHNQMRMARRNLGDAAWLDWIARFEAKSERGVFDQAWKFFQKNLPALNIERDALMARRVHDEYWYASEFGLSWPLTLPGSPIAPPATSIRPRFDRPCLLSATVTVIPTTPVRPRKPVESSFVDQVVLGEPLLVG